MAADRAASGTDAVVRRAARLLGLQTAALVAVAVLGLTAVAMVLTSRAQDQTAHQLVTDTAAAADDVGDPPPHCWLSLRTTNGTVSSTRSTPAGLPDRAALAEVAGGGPAREQEVDLPGGRFLVYTEHGDIPGAQAVQAALDLAPTEQQRHRLLTGLGLAALAGLVLAGAVGLFQARRMLAPLRRTMELQRQFIADASHELRTPLTLLHTRVQMLQRDLADAPDLVRAEAAGVVGDSARLAELVEDLLVAAEPQSSQARTDIRLDELIDETVAAARSYAEERQVELRHDTSTRPVTVRGSSPALRRALVALIDNAIEHTPAGGHISVRATHTSTGQVELTVTDTGTGFDPDTATRLTDRFHSGGHRTGRRRYGLGLALANDIADRHGGHLTATSTPGTGATFTLTLPRTDH